MQNTGIYKIVNKTNGIFYVGSSKNIQYRWNRHKKLLRQGVHTNDYLQNAWNKYGEDCFDFIIVETVDPQSLLIVEQRYLDLVKINPNISYNLCYTSTGSRLSSYSIEKIRKASTGKKHTEETKQKLRECRNKQTFSDESRRKSIEALLKCRGNRTIPDILHFKNVITNEGFVGRRIDFIKKYTLNKNSVMNVVRKKWKQYNSWVLIEPEVGVPDLTSTPTVTVT